MMSFDRINDANVKKLKTTIDVKEDDAKNIGEANANVKQLLSWCSYGKRERTRQEEGRFRSTLVPKYSKRRKTSSPCSEDSSVSDDLETYSSNSPSRRDMPSGGSSPPPPEVPNGYIACGWCRRIAKAKVISFKSVNGDKSFCSEICFTQCRRASFKRNKTCDWCKHVRHSVNYVDYQEGDHQLQFCNGKCLNQYKMNIFCRETQAHLDLHPHLQVHDSETTKSVKNTNGLITPDLWLRDCQSDPSPPSTPSPPACVPSPLIEVKVSPSSTPPPPLSHDPPSINSSSNSNSNSNSSACASEKVRKEILSRKRHLKGKDSTSKNNGSRLKKGWWESGTSCPPSNMSQNISSFNVPPFLPSSVLPDSSTHKPSFLNNLLPPGFPQVQHRPALRLPPPLLPINRPLFNTSTPPQSLIPPTTILVPYPVAVPIPLPIPIPIPLSVFAKLKRKEGEKSNESTESSADRVTIKSEPLSPAAASSFVWQQEDATSPPPPEKRKHFADSSMKKQKPISSPCL